jgi:folylpolyglutamate synthase/dihydropteroate synthase
VIACLAVLDDKDAAGMARSLAPAVSRAVCTSLPPEALAGARPGVRAWDAEELARLCREAGITAEVADGAGPAFARARELARESGGVALATGSHYLLGALWTERQGQSFSR